MPRSKSIPTYRYHISGQAIVTFCQKNFYLGPHNSQDSFARYNALVAEYIANGMVAPPGETRLADKPLTVACITAAYRRELPNKFPTYNPPLLRPQMSVKCSAAGLRPVSSAARDGEQLGWPE